MLPTWVSFALPVTSYVSYEGRVPQDHPLRRVLPLVDAALTDLSPEFAKLYALIGRPSIAPEKLLRALLLQALYSVRSERHLMEQLDYNCCSAGSPASASTIRSGA